MVTIREVSRLAGVSTGTVSNVLSGKRPVSDTVRNRVLKIIEELDYQPNIAASSLVTGSSKTIVVIMNDFQRVSEEFLIGVDSGLRQNGYSLLVNSIGSNEDPLLHLRSLANRQIDGIIWTIPELYVNLNLWNTKKNRAILPMVFTFDGLGSNQSFVGIDNISAGYSATRHLIEHGCTKIGHISGPKSSIEAINRKQGWEKALLEENLIPDIDCECDWNGINMESCISQILEKQPDIDGLFAVNDLCALTAISALHKNNRSVPKDVKVIGFDDMRLLNYIEPSLTTVRQDFFRIGLTAAIEVQRRIQDPESSPKNNLIPTELIARHSCGCKVV